MGASANAFRRHPLVLSSSLPSGCYSSSRCKVSVRRGALNCGVFATGLEREVMANFASRPRIRRGTEGMAALSAPHDRAGGGDCKIPKEFVWPEESRPDLLHDQYEVELPVVDLSVLSKLKELKGQEAEVAALASKTDAVIEREAAIKQEISRLQPVRRELLNEIRKAVLEYGFFSIINHGFPNDLLYNLSSTAHRFFERSDEEKGNAVLSPSGDGHGFGYNGPWIRTRDNYSDSPRVWQETVMLACPGSTSDPNPDMIDCLAPLIADPGHAPWVNSLIKRYTTAAEAVAVSALELIAESLKLPPNYFAHHLVDDDNPIRLLRLNYGPRCCQPELTWGSRPHTDPVAITLLHQDQVGGLQVLTRAGRWLAVQPVPDAFIISAGDLLQAWTNDRVMSPQHRVVTNKDRARLSMAVFYLPSAETVIAPPPEMVDEDNPLAYRRFTVEEFAAATKTRGTEAGNTLLNQFRIHPEP